MTDAEFHQQQLEQQEQALRDLNVWSARNTLLDALQRGDKDAQGYTIDLMHELQVQFTKRRAA